MQSLTKVIQSLVFSNFEVLRITRGIVKAVAALAPHQLN